MTEQTPETPEPMTLAYEQRGHFLRNGHVTDPSSLRMVAEGWSLRCAKHFGIKTRHNFNIGGGLITSFFGSPLRNALTEEIRQACEPQTTPEGKPATLFFMTIGMKPSLSTRLFHFFTNREANNGPYQLTLSYTNPDLDKRAPHAASTISELKISLRAPTESDIAPAMFADLLHALRRTGTLDIPAHRIEKTLVSQLGPEHPALGPLTGKHPAAQPA